MAAAAGSKVFILDKYFYELQRFWDTEKKSESESVARSAECNFPIATLITFPSARSHYPLPKQLWLDCTRRRRVKRRRR